MHGLALSPEPCTGRPGFQQVVCIRRQPCVSNADSRCRHVPHFVRDWERGCIGGCEGEGLAALVGPEQKMIW
jgi:hypothetical protein